MLLFNMGVFVEKSTALHEVNYCRIPNTVADICRGQAGIYNLYHQKLFGK